MRNAEIALAFDELADLYELDGAVVYRVGAYRDAAKAIREATVSVEELARAGRAQEIPGVGKKGEKNTRIALDAGADGRPEPRTLLSTALRIAEGLRDALREHPGAGRVEIAGSARRWTDTCKDIDLVATASDPRALADAFCSMPLIAEANSPGEAGARGITHNGISVDLRIVPPDNFGNLIQHLTGSKQHNEALRTAAVKRGFHVSEYGVTDDSTETTHACATEEEVYDLLGMDWVPPELRENRGELDAARERQLPPLVELGDIRGELHCH